MNDTIRAGLRALADQAPRGALPDGFYEAARARHRGRRAAALTAVAVLLLVTGVGWALRPGDDGATQPAQGGGPGIATSLPVPPWYTGGTGDLGVTAAIYGGPATTDGLREGRFAGLSADGERCRVFGGGSTGYTAPGFDALLSPDGTRIAREGTVTSLLDGTTIGIPGDVKAFSPDGTLVVYQSVSTVGVYDLGRRAATAQIDETRWLIPGGPVAVAPGNDRMAVATGDELTVYDLRTGRSSYTLPLDGGELAGHGAWLPDGSAFATAARAGTTWTLMLRRATDGAVLDERRFAPVTDARYLRLLGWRADGTAVAVAGIPVPGAKPPVVRRGGEWGPYSDLGASGARVVEVGPAEVRTVLRTPAGVRELDVAADLAVAGAFRPPGDPGFGAGANPVVYLGGLCLVVGCVTLAVVVVRRNRRGRSA